jgi:hypothetical protein
MPDTLPIIFAGNYYTEPDYSSGQSLRVGGHRIFEYIGYAEVNTATGNSIVLRNDRDQPCMIPCPLDSVPLSAVDPALVSHISFYIPRVGEVQAFNGRPVAAPVTAGATDVLKLAAAANVDLTVNTTLGAVSLAAVAGVIPSGILNGEAISLNSPVAPIALTAATELRLLSATAAGSAGVAGGNIRTAAGRILIPVRVVYSRRLRSPGLGSFGISSAQREIFDRLP